VFWPPGSGAAAPQPPASKNEPKEVPAVRVEVVKPQKRSSSQPAQVEPMEQVDIVAKINGFLKSYEKDLAGQEIDTGSRIRSGQAIAILSVPELEKELKLKQASRKEAESAAVAASKRLSSAEKELGKYQAEERYHGTELNRYEDLFKRASIEKSLLDQKRSAHEAARAGLESAQARVAQARADLDVANDHVAVSQLDLERVGELWNYATVRAPDRGPKALYVVTRRWADPGSYLHPAASMKPRESIVSLARVDEVKVTVELPELDAAVVEIGDPCTFVASALPGQKFTGKVSRHASALDPATRSMRVEIDFPNPGGRPLYPGMYGNVFVALGEKKSILTVPSRSIRKEGDQTFVYAIVAGKATRMPVKLGVDDGASTEILAGLKEDSQVVRTAFGALKDGAAVSILEKK
jgi:multidrug efflux pump subunit AcrA (membrane-fusion protein)